MAREAPRRKKENVYADYISWLGVAMGYRFRRRRDPAQAVRIDRVVEQVRRRTPLHLDKDYRPSAPRDQVNLAARGLEPLRQNPPAFEPQIERRQRLTAPPLGFATGTLVHLSSSARA
jgi:hypothetical protein